MQKGVRCPWVFTIPIVLDEDGLSDEEDGLRDEEDGLRDEEDGLSDDTRTN